MSVNRAWRATPIRFRDRSLWLLLASIGLLIGALFSPAFDVEQRLFRHLLVFDITQSMNVPDMGDGSAPISRLEFSKQAARKALTALPCGSEVGVGLFAGHRSLLLFAPVEVCAHYEEIGTVVDNIDWRMAWVARSEVAKGLHSALAVTRSLGARTTTVFLTDGHEAPPINPNYPPTFRGVVGEVDGILAGVGGAVPTPIPKLDARGALAGYWGRDEVMQIDVFSMGRRGSVTSESMTGVDETGLESRIANGTEHLSSLREDYLKTLAAGLGLEYRPIATLDGLGDVVSNPSFAFTVATRGDLRSVFATLALICLVAGYLWTPALRRGGRA